MCIGKTVRHPHIPRPPLRERQPRHLTYILGICNALPILNFKPQHQFPIWIQRPWIRHLRVLRSRKTPNTRSISLTARPALTLHQPAIQPGSLEGIPALLDKRPYRIGLPRMRMQNTVHPRTQNMPDLPRIGANLLNRTTIGWQRRKHSRRTMPRICGTAIHQPLHKRAKPHHIKRTVLVIHH